MWNQDINHLKKEAKYFRDFYQLEDIAAEIDLWFYLWEGKQVTDDKLKEKDIEIINLLNPTDVCHLTIRQALLILSTIPRTTTTVERSFSTLRRVRTWLRSTMGEERLTGLCLLSVYRGIVKAKREQLGPLDHILSTPLFAEMAIVKTNRTPLLGLTVFRLEPISHKLFLTMKSHSSILVPHSPIVIGNTIVTLFKSEIDSKITFWRDVMHRIINVIITLVSCNLHLRGHDSDSGNFMAISRLLSNYDATLKELRLKPKSEINYLSPTIQNEIISLLGTTVRNNIISEIKKAPFLTIILDTTQDLPKIDQLSVVFRYISVTENDDNVPKEIKICESSLGFTAVTDCSAAGLRTVILNLTKEYGIDLTKCRGQGYDGANVMSGVYGGLQTLIKEHTPNADYVHCAAHALNLVLNDAARHVREVSTFSII
nr:unnamed protein product [Callosobruchus analis]